MKSRLLIIIGIFVALGFWISFVAWETYHSQPIESIDESTYMSSDESLQRVLDHCESQRKFAAGEIPERNADGSYNVIDLPGLSYQNATHSIDNNVCEWRLLENYPNSDKICIPGQYVENNEHRIRNDTHIYNNDACMWEILEICTGYCGELENEN